LQDRSRVEHVKRLRQAYAKVCRGLPWLDACAWPDDPPAFPAYAHAANLPAVAAAVLEPPLLGRVTELRKAGRADVVRYRADRSGPLGTYDRLLSELAEAGVPLCVLHTEVPLPEVAQLAARLPTLPVVVESGPLKLLYHIAECESLLHAHPNTRLCTYNLCNWLGLERLCEAGLADRLLFGTHSPRYSPHAAMGPVALGRLSWRQRCAIAGNNLRRLLGRPPLSSPEVETPNIPPFIVDAHTHTGPNGRFPVPDEGFSPADWLSAMDEHVTARMVVCPYEALTNPAVTSAEQTRALRGAANGRVRYLQVFDPRDPDGLSRVAAALPDPECAGIKIHPSFHETPADDARYGPLFRLAAETGAPVLTHSWDISPTNPVQRLSHPDRFRRHLVDYPNVTLILGHAGGRPDAMESVLALCAEFPRVHVDLAGDYYDDGLVELLVDRLGPERVIFGSDLNWTDPRANLAPVLASGLSDSEAHDILCGNALRVYWRRDG
jgi:predicted TIM-barrel fold metal-dependent hydrolase